MNKYKFSRRSKLALSTANPRFTELCNIVLGLGIFDFGVISGNRGEDEQNKLYFQGYSKVKFPHSKHNKTPSDAIDWVLYINGKPNWTDTNSYYMAIGVFLAVAATIDFKIISGGDWSGDFSTKDQSFFDLGHLEKIICTKK